MLTLVPYLQSRDGIPVKQVAADFGVSTKQIVKDLNVLWFCGLPQAMPGEMIDVDMDALELDGIVRIDNAEYLDRPLRLDRGEAAALIVALRTLRASSTQAQSDVIDGVLAKLEALVGELATSPAHVHVEEADPVVQDTLTRALAARECVRITYATPARDEVTERTIEPLRLFAAQGRRFVEAWCRRVDDLRTFRLDRIETAEPTGEHYEPREVAPEAMSEGTFRVGDDTPSAVLDLHPDAHWLTEYYDVERLGEPEPDVVRIRLHGSTTEWLRRLVLRNGGAVRVVEPADLAGEVRATAARALAAYDEDTSPHEES
jgi:proteasome accessory factor C